MGMEPVFWNGLSVRLGPIAYAFRTPADQEISTTLKVVLDLFLGWLDNTTVGPLPGLAVLYDTGYPGLLASRTAARRDL